MGLQPLVSKYRTGRWKGLKVRRSPVCFCFFDLLPYNRSVSVVFLNGTIPSCVLHHPWSLGLLSTVPTYSPASGAPSLPALSLVAFGGALKQRNVWICRYLLILLGSKEDVPCHSDIIPLAKDLTATEQTFFFFHGLFNQTYLGQTDPVNGGFGLLAQNYSQWLTCRVVVWLADWKCLRDRVLILTISFGNFRCCCMSENRPGWFLLTLGADNMAK